MIAVEVAYALPGEQVVVALQLPAGATVREAIVRSQLSQRFAIDGAPVGVFGRVVPMETVLRDGDRVEIYRKLAVDPTQARRDRARR